MNQLKVTNRHLVKLLENYWNWRWLWMATTAAFAILALVYVLVLKSDQWVASQGLMIRDEASGTVMRLGRFESQTEMKAAQETVLEMARSAQVLEQALRVVGREPSFFGRSRVDSAASVSELEDLGKEVSVRAPRGAELGTTEVIYLEVRQGSRERALKMNIAICDALESRLNQVREARATSVINELQAAKQAAAESLHSATERLKQIEADVGNDLSDLRGLTDNSANPSSTRVTLDAVLQELRAAELELHQTQLDLSTAQESFQQPDQLLQTPTKLVNSHPGLKRLREGLAAAAISTSELSARYTQQHPLVLAAQQTEERIREELRQELGRSVATLTKDFELANARVEKLKQQRNSLEMRIAKLASVRAEYENLSNEVKARSAQLQDAERELSAAGAARDASLTSSLLTRIDSPSIGENPVGPGRMTILAGATLSGLLFGLGIVFLLTPMDVGVNYGRRSTDYSGVADRRSPSRNADTPQSNQMQDAGGVVSAEKREYSLSSIADSAPPHLTVAEACTEHLA